MKMKRLISFVIVLLLMCGMPVSAFADTWYVDDGSITVIATESGQTVSQGETIINDDAPVITQSNSSTPTTNTVTINAAENATANVTIQDVNINTGSRGGSAIRTAGAGNVVIELDGTNTVQSSGAYAGVQKTNFGNLTIADENGTDGSLKATGGNHGAGIGGGPAVGSNGSDITISGGTIEAIGGDNGAGIGGGGGGFGSNITISGSAEVTAKGGESGAGIGGGAGNIGYNITISGGTIEAIGGDNGAGIGGGGGGFGSNITISGSAEVTAKGGESGAGIGGGASNLGTNITISGGNVEASGGASASGIGGGAGGTGSIITITGSAEVTAKGGTSGAGIGGGRQNTGIDITVSGDAQVKAQGGCDRVYPSVHFGSGAAIGEGGNDDPDNNAGAEVDPNTDALTTNGKIEYYSPGANMENDNPIKTVTGTVPPQNEEKPPVDEEKPDRPSQSAEAVYSEPLYRVIDQDGKDIPYKAEQSRGVLTITVDADFASLTGSLGGINALKEQGIDTIVFVTKGASSTFALSDLLAQGSTGDSYTLNHNGDTVSFTLGEAKTDINEILAQP